MKALVFIVIFGLACGREVLRADARPTSEFPQAWSSGGTRATAQAPVQPPPQKQVIARGLIAVLDLNNKLRGAEREQLDGAYFANQIRAEIKRRVPTLGVMTRENILVLLQAGGKTLSDCEGECEVDTGRRLGADYVVSGDMLKVGSKFKVDLRLHDTRDGQLISGATDSGATVDELDARVGAAIEELIRPLR